MITTFWKMRSKNVFSLKEPNLIKDRHRCLGNNSQWLSIVSKVLEALQPQLQPHRLRAPLAVQVRVTRLHLRHELWIPITSSHPSLSRFWSINNNLSNSSRIQEVEIIKIKTGSMPIAIILVNPKNWELENEVWIVVIYTCFLLVTTSLSLPNILMYTSLNVKFFWLCLSWVPNNRYGWHKYRIFRNDFWVPFVKINQNLLNKSVTDNKIRQTN